MTGRNRQVQGVSSSQAQVVAIGKSGRRAEIDCRNREVNQRIDYDLPEGGENLGAMILTNLAHV